MNRGPMNTDVNPSNFHLPSGSIPVSAPPGAIASLKEIWRGFRQEHAAFIVTCLYLIFEYNRPQLVYPALDIIPWGKTLLLLAIVLAFLDKSSRRPSVAALLPMLAFSSCILMSMIFAYSPSVAMKEWVTYFAWVVVVLLITSVVNTRKRLFLFIAVYFLCNLKMAQHGFKSWAMSGFGFSSWGVTGSPGWFQNSGEFSMEMVVFLPFLIAYISFFRHEWSRSVQIFFYLLTVMVTGSIIASSSRGAILGLVIVGLWCLAYARQRFKASLILALVAVVVYYVTPSEFKARFETAGEDKTSLNRKAYWVVGRKAIRDYPVFGVGFRNWTIWAADNHPELKGAKGWGENVEVVHNTYLEAATELGYSGVFAYFIIILQVFISNRRARLNARICKDRFMEATAIGLNGSLLAYMITSYFMSVLYYPYIWVLLALTMCLSYICKQGTSDSSALIA